MSRVFKVIDWVLKDEVFYSLLGIGILASTMFDADSDSKFILGSVFGMMFFMFAHIARLKRHLLEVKDIVRDQRQMLIKMRDDK